MLDRSCAQAGLTLAELLVTLGIVAVLAVTAVPSFARWRQDLARDAAVTTALHAVHQARQLAAVRGWSVSLCGSRDGLACTGTDDWSGGLLVAPGGGQARSLPVGGAARLRANRAVIRFAAGSGSASPATLTVCDRRGARAARMVIVSRSGRPRATMPGAEGPSC